MKEGLLGGRLGVASRSEHEEARSYVACWIGSESTPARCLLDRRRRRARRTRRAPPDADGLRHLAERLRGQPVRAVIESMTGARFVHDTLEEGGARRRTAPPCEVHVVTTAALMAFPAAGMAATDTTDTSATVGSELSLVAPATTVLSGLTHAAAATGDTVVDVTSTGDWTLAATDAASSNKGR
jgi:hypothetical protein